MKWEGVGYCVGTSVGTAHQNMSMLIGIRTFIGACVRPSIFACLQTCMHTCMHAYMDACKHACIIRARVHMECGPSVGLCVGCAVGTTVGVLELYADLLVGENVGYEVTGAWQMQGYRIEQLP